MVLRLQIPLAFLLGFAAFVSLQQHQQFSYHDYKTKFIPPWQYLDNMSDMDLYSYLLARRMAHPFHSQIASHRYHQLAPDNFATSAGSPLLKQYPVNNEAVIVQGSPSDTYNTEHLGAQSRNRYGGNQQVRPYQPDEAQVNPRFLLNFVTTIGSTNSFFNPLMKTIYYFTTTTTTLTFTSTCIAVAAFVDAASANVVCRKRRALLEVLSALDKVEDDHGETAKILPTMVEQVIPTASPTTPTEDIELASSMREEGQLNENLQSTDAAVLRVKRFFFSTTIVTTYIFSSITNTRTLTTNLAADGELSCRPSQFGVC